MAEGRCTAAAVPLFLVVVLATSLCAGAATLKEEDSGPRSLLPAEDHGPAVRAQLDELRRQVETLRTQEEERRRRQVSPEGGGGNRARNDRLTAQWVRAAVRELRAEAEESAASQRRSAAEARLQHAEVSSALSLLRSDAASLRRDLEESRAEVQRLAAQVALLSAELVEVRAASAGCSQAEAEMKALQSEWLDVSKTLQASATERSLMMEKIMDVGNGQKSDGPGSDEPKVRHLGHIHKQLYSLRQSDKQMFTGQMLLEKRVRKLEKVVKAISDRAIKKSESSEQQCKDGNHKTALGKCELQSLVRQLEDKVAGVEEVQRISAKSIAFNSSRQTAALDKLHLSTLQLLESVQAVEDKVDQSLPELQREISKLEFGMAQALASSRAAKEDQEGSQEAIKAMRETLEVLQEKERGEVGALGAVQAQMINMTNRMEAGEQALASQITRLKDSLAVDFPEMAKKLQHDEVDNIPTNSDLLNSTPVKGQMNSDLPNLFHRLTKIEKDYLHVVEQLPKDCSEVTGPSGLYLLRPLERGDKRNQLPMDGGSSSSLEETLPSPLLAYCDQDTHGGGWTVVQRRINGHEDFNRNWKEYQDGFGSPAGEFWIGNEALHRMTHGDNCTSLRVDMVDIYGRAWYAEYSTFLVASEKDGYRLSASGYHGDAGDALDYQDAMQFSAKDSDRDTSSTDCAASYEGGWWFSHCQHANLNGRYGLGLTWFDGTRNEWIAVAHSVMKVHRGSMNGKCSLSSRGYNIGHASEAQKRGEAENKKSDNGRSPRSAVSGSRVDGSGA